MEKMVAQYGVTAVTQKHLHLRKHLLGSQVGAMEEVEEETLEAGVNSLGEDGGSSTLRRPKEAGMPQTLLLRIHRLALGAEL